MRLYLTLIAFLILTTSAFAKKKIVGGNDVPLGHPGEWNTVALVKEDGKIFCTGSIIAKDLILTAKHCLIDKEADQINVFFGSDTNEPDLGEFRTVKALSTRRPDYWEHEFPSFDVAWVKLNTEVPDSFHPISLVADESLLRPGMDVHLVGHGNRGFSNQGILAGLKRHMVTQFKEYIDSPRFFNVLLIEGEPGQGACHGDSGGPLYIKTGDSGDPKQNWAVAGITNGFDVVLTPRTMTRSSDPDFPYNVTCENNQILYSFTGGHVDWIQRTSEIELQTQGEVTPRGPSQEDEFHNFKEWCQSRSIGTPSWNLLKFMLDQVVDENPQQEARDFYMNCEKIESILSKKERLYLDGNDVLQVPLSFHHLKFLPSIKQINISNYRENLLNLASLSDLQIEQLKLTKNGLQNLDFLLKENGNFNIKELSLSQQNLTRLDGIDGINGLESLILTNNGDSRFVMPVLENLRSLDLEATLFDDIGWLNLHSRLKTLRISHTPLGSDIDALPMHLELKELNLGPLKDETKVIDLTAQVSLEFLRIRDAKSLSQILGSFPLLREAHLSGTDVSDLSFLSDSSLLERATLTFNQIKKTESLSIGEYPKLESLNLSRNPLVSLSGLQNAINLKYLKLFGTPLKSGTIGKTPENCPRSGSSVLIEFCSKN